MLPFVVFPLNVAPVPFSTLLPNIQNPMSLFCTHCHFNFVSLHCHVSYVHHMHLLLLLSLCIAAIRFFFYHSIECVSLRLAFLHPFRYTIEFTILKLVFVFWLFSLDSTALCHFTRICMCASYFFRTYITKVCVGRERDMKFETSKKPHHDYIGILVLLLFLRFRFAFLLGFFDISVFDSCFDFIAILGYIYWLQFS